MIVDLVILVALAAFIYVRSRATKVDHNNVNDEWTGSVAPAEPEHRGRGLSSREQIHVVD